MDRTFWDESVEDEYPEDAYPHNYDQESFPDWQDLCDADTIARMTPEEFERI